jgi:F-type H+-transporting ATPase subunit b
LERLFTLDAQLLFDTLVMALSMLLLFTLLSYLLFNPVRDMLEKRKQRIVDDREAAKREKEEATNYKQEYEKKLQEVDKEVQVILSEARKKAMKNENAIIAEAKEEAARIMARANAEIELEKKRALDDMKQEMIAIASMMAQKVVSASIDTEVQESLIDETLKEMGENTWLS